MNSCSLLIPCYNAENYLPMLWETVRVQTVPFDEIICYDDGSTDNTANIARKLGAIVIQGKKQRGAAFARNQLAKATKCSWFHFHDADDLLQPNYLERVSKRISENVDVILCNVDWIEKDTKKLVISWQYKEDDLKKEPVNYTLSHPIGGINGLYRKNVFLSVGGFDESMQVWEDADLHIRLASAGANFAVVEEVLSISLRHSDTLSYDLVNNWSYRLQALRRYSQILETASTTIIGAEAEKVARNLLKFGARNKAREAIQLCQDMGVNPPTTQNPFLKVLKLVIPPLWILQIQELYRHCQ